MLPGPISGCTFRCRCTDSGKAQEQLPYAFAENRVIDGKDLEVKEYFPGNPTADFLWDLIFGWITDLKDGARETTEGSAQYFIAKAYESGARSDRTDSPPGSKYGDASIGEQHAVRHDETEGRTKVIRGATKMIIATADGMSEVAIATTEVAGSIKVARTLTKSEQKAVRSLTKRIIEHKDKLKNG